MWFLDFLLKEIGIDFLDFIRRCHRHANTVVNHVVRKAVSIDEYDAGRILSNRGEGVLRERRRGAGPSEFRSQESPLFGFLLLFIFT